jgi:hypothetical protein
MFIDIKFLQFPSIITYGTHMIGYNAVLVRPVGVFLSNF